LFCINGRVTNPIFRHAIEHLVDNDLPSENNDVDEDCAFWKEAAGLPHMGARECRFRPATKCDSFVVVLAGSARQL